MILRKTLSLAALTVTAVLLVLVVVTGRMDQYFSDLATWRDTSRQMPEGPELEALFEQAVQLNAVRWNPEIGQIEIRRDVPLPPALEDAMFRMREEGATISLAVQQTRYVGGFVAVRAHVPNCPAPCAVEMDWSISGTEVGLEGLALVAAETRTTGVPAPLPRLFFPLSRGAGTGYVPWQRYATQSSLVLRTEQRRLDVIDVVGRVERLPQGWQIESAWCFERGQVMVACAPNDDPVISRLTRATGFADGSATSLTVSPIRLVPKDDVEGRYYLTDRIALVCPAAVRCHPEWQTVNAPIPYARRGTAPEIEFANESQFRASVAARILGDLVDVGSNGLFASEQARALGIGSFFGDTWPSPGSILAEAAKLPDSASVGFSLDPEVQAIVREVLDDAEANASGRLFSSIGVQYPDNEPQLSFVVLDLRQEQTLGAILAAYGLPERQVSQSDWDTQASRFDRFAPLPPGSAAWTGANWRHTPGSTWKLMTSLALIDMISSGSLAGPDAVNLRQAMLGIDASRASAIFGPDALSGAAGICAPVRISGEVRGAASANGCGEEYHAPVTDNGRPGPLNGRGAALYGLEEAVAKSSNIWFISMLMTAERMHAIGQGSSGVDGAFSMEATLDRMGIINPQQLDSGLGLSILPREAAQIDALKDYTDMQALSSSAFGQRVWAGPMITAQVSGAIAVNRIITPGFFVPTSPAPTLFNSGAALPLLDELRRGMRSVVSNSDIGPGFGRGTAVSAFSERASKIASRVAGKTGTAQRDESLDRVSTFAGWLDDSNGKPLVSIGCSATVLGERSGDSVRVPQLCAHISAEILRRIDQLDGFQ